MTAWSKIIRQESRSHSSVILSLEQEVSNRSNDGPPAILYKLVLSCFHF